MIFDPKGAGDHSVVVIVAQVQSFKYLCVYIDSALTWTTCGLSVFLERMYFLHTLWPCGDEQKRTFSFYQALLSSVIKYGMTVWFENHPISVKSKLLHWFRL